MSDPEATGRVIGRAMVELETWRRAGGDVTAIVGGKIPEGATIVMRPGVNPPDPDARSTPLPQPSPARGEGVGGQPTPIDAHMPTIRSAVADALEEYHLLSHARRARCGEADHLVIMRGAVLAVTRVLEGMFK